MFLFIYLFGVLRRFQHCTGHITTGSWKDRGNQYIQLVKVLYCKLPTNGKQLPAFPLEAMTGIVFLFENYCKNISYLVHILMYDSLLTDYNLPTIVILYTLTCAIDVKSVQNHNINPNVCGSLNKQKHAHTRKLTELRTLYSFTLGERHMSFDGSPLVCQNF